jgi:cytochrome bd-type quinol oxidase subunit 1
MIDNLFIENEKASVSKMGELIALVVSTWAIVHMVIKGTVTSDLFIGYLAAWVSNRGIRHWIDRKYKSNSE